MYACFYLKIRGWDLQVALYKGNQKENFSFVNMIWSVKSCGTVMQISIVTLNHIRFPLLCLNKALAIVPHLINWWLFIFAYYYAESHTSSNLSIQYYITDPMLSDGQLFLRFVPLLLWLDKQWCKCKVNPLKIKWYPCAWQGGFMAHTKSNLETFW